MNIIIAPSTVGGVCQKSRYQYLLLDQIWRDACSDPFTWGNTPLEGSSDPLYSQRRNIETGDTILCRGHADGSHTFVFTGA